MIEVSEAQVKSLAKMVHEANRAFCEEIGDFSQKPWTEAPGYNHESAMAGVQAIIDNPKITNEDIHNVWMEQKKADGWAYGETKDKEKKTHPSMVPYAELSTTERYKDSLVRYVVLSYVDFREEGL